MSELLSARNVTVRLGGTTVVERASLALHGGELAVLVGPNGAGKTTLLRALAGLIPADGALHLRGKLLAAQRPRERARNVAYLPQGHTFHWPMSVAAIVMLGREPHADPFSGTSAQDRAAVERALMTTETLAFANRAVTTLSGGERARVALARALATQAGVLLADEPTASLDPRHQLVVMALLRQSARAGNAILATMHDLTLAARFADRIIVMHQGRLVGEGAPAEALSPDRLATVFGVETQFVDLAGARIPVPLRPFNPHPEEPA
jgi:iron complex transport system ATP-binding protein